MPDGKFDKTWVQSFVDSEYRGNLIRFYPLDFQDTIAFFEIWEGSPAEILSKNKDKLQEFVAKSLRCEKKDLADTSPGFLLFAMENLLKAVDIDFLAVGSRTLGEQMQTILQKVDKTSLPPSSENSPEKKDGEPTTS